MKPKRVNVPVLSVLMLAASPAAAHPGTPGDHLVLATSIPQVLEAGHPVFIAALPALSLLALLFWLGRFRGLFSR